MPLGYRTTIPTNTALDISPTSYTEVPATIYYNNNPPNVTYAGSQPLFTPYNGGSSVSAWSQFPAITNINASDNDLNNVNVGNISTINTNKIDLDGNILTTGSSGSNAELLLNGIPIATVSSITAIEDWSLYPAISTINVSNYDLQNVSTINGAPYITGSASAWSQFPATQTVDFAQYNLNNVSTINGQPYVTGSASAWSAFPATQTVNMDTNSLNKVSAVNLNTSGEANVAILTAGVGGVLNVNGVPVSTGGGANTWATFPATSNVSIPNFDLNMTSTSPGVAYNTANLNANIIIGNGTQSPLRPDFTAFCGTVQLGGIASPLTAMNVNSIGGINLTSLSGVAVSGGGGVSISGAGGVAITGAGGVALNGGNVEIAGAGGVLVNGTGAIVVTAGGVAVNGGGVAISAGGCAITAGGLSVAGGAVTIGTAGIAGGNLTIFGGDLNMSAVGGSTSAINTDKLSSVGTNTLAITGLSTINGAPYTGGGGSGVASVNGLTGAITLSAGTNISLVPVGNTITVNQINVPVTNRSSGTTPVSVTATTSGTAQTFANLSLSTTAIYDIDVFAIAVITTNSNSNTDMNFFITIDGVQVGQVFSSTLGGIGHFLSFPVQCSQLNATAGAHTILLKGYASSASVITVNSFQLCAIGNLA